MTRGTVRRLLVGATLGFAATVAVASQAEAQVATVVGTVWSSSYQSPVSGATVRLLHQQLGQSVPAQTAPNGAFSLNQIPVSPLPYYLEVWFGQQLLVRLQVAVNGSNPCFQNGVVSPCQSNGLIVVP